MDPSQLFWQLFAVGLVSFAAGLAVGWICGHTR